MKFELEVTSGPDVGRMARFERATIVIGRHGDCDFVLSDASVSRRHALLKWEESEGVVEDLGSRHGSLVEGEPLMGQRPFQGAIQLVLGNTCLIVRPLVEMATDRAVPPQHSFAAGAQFLTEAVGDRAIRYWSEGPQPPIAELLAGLANFRGICLLVDPLAKGELSASAREALAPLLESTDTIAHCPLVIPSPEALEAAAVLEGSDYWVAYFGDSWDALLEHLRNLARSRVTADDEIHAPVLLPLWRPSLLTDLVFHGESDFPDRLLDGIRAVVMEREDAGTWQALATQGLTQPLEYFGFQPIRPMNETTMGTITS